jgi:hypothetical protein
MKKEMKKVFYSSVILIVLTCVFISGAYARTSYDITNVTGGGGVLNTTARRTFTGADLAKDWIPSEEFGEGTGLDAKILTGDAPAPAGGDCLMMQSDGEPFYTYRLQAENQVINMKTNSNLLTGRFTNQFRISFFVKTVGLADGVKPYIEVAFSPGSALYAGLDYVGEGIDTGGVWQEIDCVFTVPELIEGKVRTHHIKLHLPGEGTVYWDHPRVWIDDFSYYKNGSTVSSLSEGTLDFTYQPIDSDYEVGDTVTMITALYEETSKGLNLIKIAPILSTTKQSDAPLQLKNSMDISSEYAKEGTIVKTFFWSTLSDIIPTTGVEKLEY